MLACFFAEVMAMPLNRRQFVTTSLAATIVPSASFSGSDPEAPLKERGARRGIVFGAAVRRSALENDRAYANAVARECAVLSPEVEMKWGVVEKIRGERDYSAADWLVSFAQRHGIAFRGHAAAWHGNLPPWAKDALRTAEGKTIFDAHVRDIVSHFKGRLTDWDVVNEAIFPGNRLPGGFGNTILYQQFGRSYVIDPFFIARQSDPKALLFYNDANLYYDDHDHEARRRAVLALLQWLKKEKAPVDGLGIQGHLDANGPKFSPAYRAFLKDVADLGLKIMITELDVNDRFVGPDTNERDRAVADHAKAFLEMTLDERAVTGVITWGLSDRYTWLNGKHKWARADGLRNRALPLDENHRRKPLWYAIAAALDAAPDRHS